MRSTDIFYKNFFIGFYPVILDKKFWFSNFLHFFIFLKKTDTGNMHPFGIGYRKPNSVKLILEK